MIAAAVPPDRFEHLAFTGKPHLRPIYAAMRDGRRALLLLPQGGGRCAIPVLPFVAPVGPDAFHGRSLGRLARPARGVALISCAIVPNVYAIAAQIMQLGHSTLIVETRPDREGEWLTFLRSVAPRASFLMCTTAEGTA